MVEMFSAAEDAEHDAQNTDGTNSDVARGRQKIANIREKKKRDALISKEFRALSK